MNDFEKMLFVAVVVGLLQLTQGGMANNPGTMVPMLPQDEQPMPAGDMCFQCRTKRNQKDMYADMTDCHFYYQCFYLNETSATGIRRQCPQGTFWHDAVLSCMPEGPIPCQDRCMDDVTAAKGCYAGTGCRQFFMCSNTASYGMCCPETMRFDEATCGCQTDETCQDQCVQVAPPVPTVVAPVQQFNATVCMDSFGSYIATVPGEASAYYQLDQQGQATEKMYCPDLVLFDVTTCRCNIESGVTMAPQPQKRQAILSLPFDQDSEDVSVSKFATYLVGVAELDSSTFARGSGSLKVNNGLLSIPGLKSLDLRNQASFCAFFKCQGSQCNQSGGILSNYMNDTEYTVVMGVQPSNTFNGRLHFWHPVGTQTVRGTFQPASNGWNHVCLTYDGNAVRLYLNGQLADTQFVGGFLSLAGCPYTVGFDSGLGYFIGNIDDVLITPFAMTQEEIDAHRTGFHVETLLSTRQPLNRSPVGKQGRQYFVIPNLVTWRQAADIECSGRGGRLAVVSTPTDRQEALLVIRNPNNARFTTFWVGLFANDVWRTQEGTAVGRQLYLPLQPIPGSDGSFRQCCYIYRPNTFIGNEECSRARGVLCEITASFPKRYVPLEVPVTNQQAGEQCFLNIPGSRLAVIDSQQDMLNAVATLRSTTSASLWVDCLKSPPTWQWVNGEQMPTNSGLWNRAEPSSDAFCGAFVGDWLSAVNCEDRKAVLCQST